MTEYKTKDKHLPDKKIKKSKIPANDKFEPQRELEG